MHDELGRICARQSRAETTNVHRKNPQVSKRARTICGPSRAAKHRGRGDHNRSSARPATTAQRARAMQERESSPVVISPGLRASASELGRGRRELGRIDFDRQTRHRDAACADASIERQLSNERLRLPHTHALQNKNQDRVASKLIRRCRWLASEHARWLSRCLAHI
jgi:hypothetical protein